MIEEYDKGNDTAKWIIRKLIVSKWEGLKS